MRTRFPIFDSMDGLLFILAFGSYNSEYVNPFIREFHRPAGLRFSSTVGRDFEITTFVAKGFPAVGSFERISSKIPAELPQRLRDLMMVSRQGSHRTNTVAVLLLRLSPRQTSGFPTDGLGRNQGQTASCL